MKRGEWLQGRGHEFEEDVDDASMCLCGIPALVHPEPQDSGND